jgi:hypothetical protein
MSRPFSERVAHDDWRHQAEHWARSELAARDVEVVGPVEQPRIRPWSTQLRLPTDAGTFWFKANCAHLAFEPALQAELAELAPDLVDRPYAIDAERRWMLTRDHGPTLGDTSEPTVDDWRRVLGRAATVQRAVAGHGQRLLATGLPDCRPASVVNRFDRLVEIFATVPEEHPGHVSGELLTDLRGARGRVADAAAELDASSLPTTWQHGDLHPWNVFAADGRLFDFGDGQWAHAAEVLSVPHAWIVRQDVIAWDAVLEAYADAWDVPLDDVAAQQRAAAVTQPVNRTLLWWGCLQEATAAEWTQWGDALLHHLARVLEP